MLLRFVISVLVSQVLVIWERNPQLFHRAYAK
jgi:hypothetical protein